MFKQDYIMTQIREMVNFFLKIIFKIDIEKLKDLEASNKEEALWRDLNYLKSLVDSGNIDTAENRLHETLDISNEEKLKLALLFYDYLNSLDDNYLEKNNFSRKEVKEGLTQVLKIYGQEKNLGMLF